jgi:hypothetical protein
LVSKSKLDSTHEQYLNEVKVEREELERRNGIGEDVDPGDFSRSGFLEIIGRESIRNGASSVVGFNRRW